MKNSHSNIFAFNKKILSKTIKNLNKDKIMGLPTETVYGLGGNAYSKKAIKKIFDLKKRPKFNPLIVHYYNLSRAKKDVVINEEFKKLYKRFCPGPITFVLNKNKKIKLSKLATANKNTVSIRIPNHIIAKK